MPAKSGTDWSNVPARLGSALVIGALVVVALWFGGWVWALFAAVLAVRMAFEWARMSQTSGQGYLVLSAAAILTVALYGLAPATPYLLVGFVIALLAPLAVPTIDRKRAVIGAAYIMAPLVAMLWLRGFEPGFESAGFKRVIFIILVVVAADAGAYFAGKSIGGPKLAPKLSPNKTWAGFGGGLILGALLGGAMAQLMGGAFITGVLVGAVLVVAAVFGDFLESGFKRRFGVKDTGGLIPGHGGVLDRVDSHMAALTVAALVIALAPQLSPV